MRPARHITRRSLSPVGAVLGLIGLLVLGSAAVAETSVARGEYLSTIMGCTGCHTGGALRGKPDPRRFLAGSDVGFLVPGMGVFYPSNLTPDDETGIGRWSEAQIITAIRHGLRPDGRELAPVMPWESYTVLTDADAAALAAFLKSLPPVRFAVPRPHGPDAAPSAPYLMAIFPDFRDPFGNCAVAQADCAAAGGDTAP